MHKRLRTKAKVIIPRPATVRKTALCVAPSGCNNCGRKLTGRQQRWCSQECAFGWYNEHLWSFARKTAMVRANWRCVSCGKRAEEVDHIKPRLGMPIGKPSCLHHQSNLRALCHTCHVNRKTVFGEV